MKKQALRTVPLILLVLAFASNSWAQLKWIPEKERPKAKLSGDLKTPDGKKISLGDLKAKVVFLNFWATWCVPCKKEMPSMGTLFTQLKDQGLEMIAVTNSSGPDVQKFLSDKSFDFTILLDPKDSLGNKFRTEIMPTTIVIDSKGRVALRRGGEFAWDSPEAVEGLKKLLAEQP